MNASETVRAWYRRGDKLPLVVAILFVVCPLAYWVSNQPVPARALIAVIAASLPSGVCLGYLAGPAAAFGVTPERIIVNNPLFRYSVPRHLFEDISVLENVAVQIVTKGGGEVPIHAVLPAIGSPYSQSYRQLLSKVRTLFQMIEDVPAAPTAGSVERTPRLGSILLVGVSAASFALSVFLLTG